MINHVNGVTSAENNKILICRAKIDSLVLLSPISEVLIFDGMFIR